jgi:hypothetical protein
LTRPQEKELQNHKPLKPDNSGFKQYCRLCGNTMYFKIIAEMKKITHISSFLREQCEYLRLRHSQRGNPQKTNELPKKQLAFRHSFVSLRAAIHREIFLPYVIPLCFLMSFL